MAVSQQNVLISLVDNLHDVTKLAESILDKSLEYSDKEVLTIHCSQKDIVRETLSVVETWYEKRTLEEKEWILSDSSDWKHKIELALDSVLSSIFQEKAKTTSETTDEIEVSKFNHNGILYYRSSDNMLYNPDTEELIGVYNSDTKEIESIEEFSASDDAPSSDGEIASVEDTSIKDEQEPDVDASNGVEENKQGEKCDQELCLVALAHERSTFEVGLSFVAFIDKSFSNILSFTTDVGILSDIPRGSSGNCRIICASSLSAHSQK